MHVRTYNQFEGLADPMKSLDIDEHLLPQRVLFPAAIPGKVGE